MSRLPHVSKKAVTTGDPPATPLSAAVKETATTTTTTTVQSSSNAVKKPPRELRRLPPIIGGGEARANIRRKNSSGEARADIRRKSSGASDTATAGTDLPERAAKAWMRRALAKRVATRMLERTTAPAPAPAAAADELGSGREKVIACCCARLPVGLRCALHQDGAPGRAWMRSQRRGGEWGEAVAVAAPMAHGWAFSEYARWRRHVWMPSRFYLERVEAEEHRAAAILVPVMSHVQGKRHVQSKQSGFE